MKVGGCQSMGELIPYDKEIFIKRLKALRKENDLTQPDLAKILGMSRGAIGHWEVGGREPGLNVINTLAQLFKVSVDYMLGNSDFRNEEDSIDYMFEKIREAGLVRSDDTIDKETVDKLMEMIEVINKIKHS